jgi:hypothetical protein
MNGTAPPAKTTLFAWPIWAAATELMSAKALAHLGRRRLLPMN